MIYCYTDSPAHQYADKYTLPYVLLDGDPNEIFNKTDETEIYVEPEPTPDPEPDVMKGDVDGDRSVTSADALAILRGSLDPTQLSDEQKAAADVNNDGTIDSSDALAVLRMSLGM